MVMAASLRGAWSRPRPVLPSAGRGCGQWTPLGLRGPAGLSDRDQLRGYLANYLDGLYLGRPLYLLFIGRFLGSGLGPGRGVRAPSGPLLISGYDTPRGCLPTSTDVG